MQYTTILLLHLISFATLMGVGAYSFRLRKSPAAFYFSLTNFLFAAFVLAIILEITSTDLAWVIFWRKLVLLPAAFIFVPWLIMVIHYTGRLEWLSRRLAAALMIIPFITSFFVLLSLASDSYNPLRYNFHISASGPLPVVLWTNGPWFWVHMSYHYSLFFISLYLLARSLNKDRPLYYRQTLVIISGALFPVAADILFTIFGITPMVGLNPAAITPSVSSVLVAWGMFHYRIMNIVPIARNKIVDTMADPLLILDDCDRIVDFNATMCDFLGGAVGPQCIGQNAWSVLTGPLMPYLSMQSAREKIRLDGQGSRRILDLSIQQISDDEGRNLGRLFLLHDISAVELAKEALEERASQISAANQQLQKEMAERQAAEAALRLSENRYRAIFENTGTAMIIVEDDTVISLVNSEFEKMIGHTKDEIEHKMSWKEFVVREDLDWMMAQHTLRRSDPGKALRSYEFQLRDRAGNIKDIMLTVDAIHETGKYVASLQDITMRMQMEEALRRSYDDLEMKVRERTFELAMSNDLLLAEIAERKRAEGDIIAALKGKEVLLREVHHRVKNNLQVISSLLYLQSKRASGGDIVDIFQDSQNRVKSMALVHEKLYRSENMGSINLSDYANSLVGYLYHCYDVHRDRIDLKFNVEEIRVEVDTAIPCGLIINVLVSNSLKYAFPDGRMGEVGIEIHSEGEDRFRMTIWDDGIGFKADPDKADTLGLLLVGTLVKQIDGTLMMDSSSGTRAEIAFREQKYKDRY